MVRTILAVLALAAAAPPDAEAPKGPAAAPAAPAAPARAALELSPVLAYVPDDADLAVLVRLGPLAKTDFWKMLTVPEVALDRKIHEGLPLAVDYSRDVASIAYVLDFESQEGRPFDVVRTAVVLETTRDIPPTDILKEPSTPQTVPGLATPAYPFGDNGLLAMPDPRVVVLVTADGAPPADYLVKILSQPARGKPAAAGPLPTAALAAPGEMTFVARMADDFRDAILQEYATTHERVLQPGMDLDQLLGFALHYNLVRMATQAQGVTASLDLTRDTDALRAEVRFDAPAMAPFMADMLQALADPLRMGLPAVLGGRPLAEPPSEAFYRATVDGRTVRLTMTRASAYRFATGLSRSAEEMAATATARQDSAANLRTLGAAVQSYIVTQGTYPRSWSDLTKANLIREPGVFRNPALAAHLATGDYALVPLTKKDAERRPWQTVLAFESYPVGAEPPRLNVLFADGHVEYLEAAQFRLLYRQTLEGLGR